LSSLFKILPPYFEHADIRGSITGLINTGNWEEVNLIVSEAGVVRGSHFHRSTLECFVILSGKIDVLFRKPLSNGAWEEASQVFATGDIFIVQPLVEHTFFIKESSKWINLLSQRVDPLMPDFHKY